MLSMSALFFLIVLATGLSHLWDDIKYRPIAVWRRWVHGGSAIIFMLGSEAGHSGLAIRIVAGVFVVVFFGGLILLLNYLQHKPLPFLLALIHGLMGVVAYILLLASLGT